MDTNVRQVFPMNTEKYQVHAQKGDEIILFNVETMKEELWCADLGDEISKTMLIDGIEYGFVRVLTPSDMPRV